jgi:hypothetical protein
MYLYLKNLNQESIKWMEMYYEIVLKLAKQSTYSYN